MPAKPTDLQNAASAAGDGADQPPIELLFKDISKKSRKIFPPVGLSRIEAVNVIARKQPNAEQQR